MEYVSHLRCLYLSCKLLFDMFNCVIINTKHNLRTDIFNKYVGSLDDIDIGSTKSISRLLLKIARKKYMISFT